MWDDRYDGDPVAAMKPRRGPVARERVVLARGLVVEHSESEWCGAVIGAREGLVQLEDGRGKVRSFPLADGFLIDGRPVSLELPKRAPQRRVTASGSIAAPQQRARVAMPSRIFVEGRHDAELVEQVWGDDLRVEGVVVELLEGADHLADVVRSFGPRPGRRLGILLDHLVEGSKESRLAATIDHPDVLITGHPFVDIWAAIDPKLIGLSAWPEVPKGQSWKDGVCAAIGEPDPRAFWKKLRNSVTSWTQLSPALVGAVEQLIDFVTEPQG